MLTKIVITLFCLIYLPLLNAGQLSETQGNIYYLDAQSKPHQLTNLGIDSQPMLSLDGKQLAFIRTPPNQLSQLWIMDVSGNNAHVLVLGHEDEEVKKNLAELNNPLFALDNKQIYFLSAAWVTSNAVHVVDITSKKPLFVTDGNSLELVPRGKYQGYLVVSKHKYYKTGGSYEEYWLVSPQGKEIKALSENEERAFIQAN